MAYAAIRWCGNRDVIAHIGNDMRSVMARGAGQRRHRVIEAGWFREC
jgi:hypothetical protein